MKELARVGFSDMRRLARWSAGGIKLIDSSELEEMDSACVQEVSETTTKDGGSVRIKLHSKIAALDQLCKHLGLYNADNTNKGNVFFTVHYEDKPIPDEAAE